MFSYVFKRVVRSWKLFVALLIGVLLASAFFSGINIGADTVAVQVLAQQLDQVPVDMVVSSGTSVILPTDVASLAVSVSSIAGVKGFEVVSRVYSTTQLQGATTFFNIVGVSNNSRVYDSLEVVNGVQTLGVNETYIDTSSTYAGGLKVGDVLTLNIAAIGRFGPGGMTPGTTYATVNLTVAGFVSLTDQSSSIASGAYRASGFGMPESFMMGRGEFQRLFQQNILIVSWEKTFSKLLDTIYSRSPSSSPVTMDVLLWLDRDTLVHPWDISGSLDTLQLVTYQVGNKAAAYGLSATNYLASVLDSYQATANSLKAQMVLLTLPVFFVAWYMGLTVSDTSFNLRRREIGLLLTNGLSMNQLLGLFLGEAALIGLIGGACAVGLGLLLNNFFPVVGGELGVFPVISPDTVLLIVVFSVALALLSVVQPARSASKLKAVDALREYMYSEEAKPRRRIWHWVALILGASKITMWIMGLNLATLTPSGFMGRGPSMSTFILFQIATFINSVLNYVGPILFFWGFTKIFILGSVKFSETLAKMSKIFLGDLSLLPTRSIRRNVPRVASVAFLLALIMGYGVQVIGGVASEQDYATRVIHANVGADLSVWLFSPTNISVVMEKIGNLSSVSSLTPEYRFTGTISLGSIQLRAVDPVKWPSTAYFEHGWFFGSDVQTAFQSLATDNNTIILDHATADSLNLRTGDTIYVNFNEMIFRLKIVGIFGPTPSQVVTGMPGYMFTQRYWSYVSDGLCSQVSASVSLSARILVKTVQGASGEAVAEEIYNLGSEVQRVDSVAEQLRVRQSNALLTGPVNVQQLGVAFTALAASVGVALVTSVTLRERNRELSLMGAGGFSFRQLVSMLLAESLGLIVFSLLLGTLVGLAIVYGNVASSNVSTQLTMRRVVFPPDSLLAILAVVALVVGSTVIPVIISARRAVSKMERIV